MNSRYISICLISLLLFSSFAVFSVHGETYENQYGKLEIYPDISNNIIRQKQFYNVTWYYPDNNLDIAFRFNNSLTYGGIYHFNGSNYNKVNYDHIEYNGKYYYILKNIHFNQNEMKHGYWEYDTLVNSSGKWDMFIKLTSDTWQFAFDNNRYVHLDPWWNSSYIYMKQLTIDHTKIDTDLVNFPILVYNSNTTMLSLMDNGNSLRFTNQANDTEFNYEIEYFDDTDEMVVWVNVTSVSSSVDTVFNMYYNNTDAVDGQNAVGTWNSNYLAVYHLVDVTDSTTTYDLTNSGANNGATGKMSDCYDFDESQFDHMQQATLLDSYPDSSTIELWINTDIIGESSRFILNKININAQDYLYCILNNDGLIRFDVEGGNNGEKEVTSNPNIISTGTWYYLAMRFTKDTKLKLNFNDDITEDSENVQEILDGTDYDFHLGVRGSDDTYAYGGLIDEVRVSQVNWNDSWIKASYHSQMQTEGFLNIGAEQEYEGFDCPVFTFSNIAPTNGSTTVSHLIENLSVTINIDTGDTFNYSIECSNGNTTSANNVGNGTYALDVCCLEQDTTYYWYVNVTHNVTCGWSNVTYNFTTKISGCLCTDEFTAIIDELKTLNENLEGDTTLVMDTTQFVIMIQLFLLCIFLWIGCSIPALEGGNKKEIHYMPFSGGLFIMFGGLDFISFAVLITNEYSLGLVGGFLTVAGIVLLIYGVLKAFYYE